MVREESPVNLVSPVLDSFRLMGYLFDGNLPRQICFPDSNSCQLMTKPNQKGNLIQDRGINFLIWLLTSPNQKKRKRGWESIAEWIHLASLLFFVCQKQWCIFKLPRQVGINLSLLALCNAVWQQTGAIRYNVKFNEFNLRHGRVIASGVDETFIVTWSVAIFPNTHDNDEGDDEDGNDEGTRESLGEVFPFRRNFLRKTLHQSKHPSDACVLVCLMPTRERCDFRSF